MPITPTFVFVNTAGVTQTMLDQIEAAARYALDQWGAVLAGSMNTTVRIEIVQQTSSGRAQGGVGQVFSVGSPGAGPNYEGAPGYELRHGTNANGAQHDFLMQIDVDYLLNELFFDATPGTSNDIPVDRTDAISVFIHEFGHGFGFIGYYNEATNSFPNNSRSPYDWRLGLMGGEVYFTGPNAQALYGGPVPLTDNNFAHYGNSNAHPSGGDPLTGLMNGVTYYRGTRYEIDDLDLAVLADLGLGTIRDDIFDQIWLDVLRGGAGDDVFAGDYSSAMSAVSINGAGAVWTAPGLSLHEMERFDVTLSAHNDTFVGGANNDIARGGQGNDSLDGGGGNDILDGGAGVDRMFGGGGDDVIYWDAADDLANVQGGSGFDLLVFRSGAAPTSFNLAMQGFEAAEGRFTDTGNAEAWTSRTLRYDSLWRLDRETLANDDGTRTVLDYDEQSNQAWSLYWMQFDALNRADLEVLTYDDGSRVNLDYDQASVHAWTTLWSMYDASNNLVAEANDYDNGTRITLAHDVVDAFDWSENWVSYDALDRVDAEAIDYDDGSRITRDHDQNDVHNWATDWVRYDALDRVDVQVITYDDGTYAVQDFDQNDDYTWQSQWWLYDANDNLIAFQGVNDDGSPFG